MVPLNDLQEAAHRLVRTVDHLPDEEYAAPSLLPGWSRAHVVAHLALNAEGLAGALTGVVRGRPIPMYASSAERDDDIAELALARPSTLRTRLLGATTEFAAAMAAVPEESWDVEIERSPGEWRFAAGAVPGMRERELEIHHADLGVAYTRTAWQRPFRARLLLAMSKRDRPRPFSVYAVDLDQTWHCGDGEGGPTVSGDGAELGWWLSGRGDGQGLTSDDGVLPGIEEW
jgi:maleylpyruvate isomerase